MKIIVKKIWFYQWHTARETRRCSRDKLQLQPRPSTYTYVRTCIIHMCIHTMQTKQKLTMQYSTRWNSTIHTLHTSVNAYAHEYLRRHIHIHTRSYTYIVYIYASYICIYIYMRCNKYTWSIFSKMMTLGYLLVSLATKDYLEWFRACLGPLV